MTFILLVSLLIPSVPLHVMANEQEESYHVSDSIKAAVKSVLNEQTPEGTTIIAVVRMYNEGTRLTRVPDLEVRARTTEGIDYIMRSSAANVIAIQPKEVVELSFMVMVDRRDSFSVSELVWVDVDEYASPRLERTITAIPVSSIEWRGADAISADPAAIKNWGEPFTISVLSNSLEYKTVRMTEQNTLQGPMTIVGLLAANKSDMKKTIPDFRVDGKSDKKVYTGKRLEQGKITLEPGEQRYIHFAIPAGDKVKLSSLSVLTPEVYTVDDKTSIPYSIGQLMINLPTENSAVKLIDQLEPYIWNNRIRLDPLNKVIQPEVAISMSSLQMHTSTAGGFKVAVAKFKLQNTSDRPTPVPRFQAELMSANGNKYTGTRQTTIVETLIPNVSYVIYYSFVLPSTETGAQLAMEIADGETITPYKIPIATFKTQVQPQKSDTELLFFPFNVKLNNWAIDVFMGIGKDNTYRLKLDMDINLQEEVVVDQSFPKMKVELIDSQGKIIGSKTLAFTGENKFVSGMQTFNFNSEIWDYSRTLRFYETVETSFGEAERLVATFKQ